MAIEITMPQLSDTMDEGTILTWLKKEGESVERGDALAEVATDKADLEIESFHEGTLLKITAHEGVTIKVGQVIALIGEAGESVSESSVVQAAPSPAPQEDEAQSSVPAAAITPPAGAVSVSGEQAQSASAIESVGVWSASTAQPQAAEVNGGQRVKISPLAKNLASSFNVDYRDVKGSGEGGRIVRKDIEQKLGRSLSSEQVEQVISGERTDTTEAPTQTKEPTPSPSNVVPLLREVKSQQSIQALSRMRQTIASRMVESANTAPHFYVTAKLEVDALWRMRESLKPLAQYEGITFNHLVIKAVALVLGKDPRLNCAYREGNLVQPQDVNIGVVTALADGLLIPVVKRADTLPLADIVAESKAMVQRARAGRPKTEDLLGGTFTLSNIGRVQVESFTAIINPGQGAILAVGSIEDEPVVKDGEIRPAKVMRVTVSVDHRVIDGVMAGEFLAELRRYIEDPVLLLA